MAQRITQRPYAGERDYQRLRAFHIDVCLEGALSPITIGDLDYWRFQHPDPTGSMQSCGLWQDRDETLVDLPGQVLTWMEPASSIWRASASC